MYENSNGGSPQTTEGAESVAGWLGVKPEDRLSFGDHDERLERKQKLNAAGETSRHGALVVGRQKIDLLCVQVEGIQVLQWRVEQLRWRLPVDEGQTLAGLQICIRGCRFLL